MRIPEHTKTLTLVLIAGLTIHAFFVFFMPFTNDEGAYLFDAKLISQGTLPAGDALTKAPVPVLLFSAAAAMSDYSLYAARAVSLILALASALPLYWLSLRLHEKTAAAFSAILWLLALPASVHILGITETVAVFFSLSFLALWLESLRFQEKKSGIYLSAALAGLYFALAYASRKTALASLAPALIIWIASRSCKRHALSAALAGTFSLILIWLTDAYLIYGIEGVKQATGIGYGEIIYQQTHGSSWTANLRWVTHTALRHFGGFAAAIALGLAFTVHSFLKRKTAAAVPLSWLAALIAMYSMSPSFMPEYLIDFFAPVVILASLALSAAYNRSRSAAYVLFAAAIIASLYGSYNTYAQPWTGMFAPSAVNLMTAELKHHVPQTEEIFTAAVILPYASGHNVPHNISHPLWYRYAFLPDNTKNTFLPPLSIIEEEIESGPVKWAVVEHLTDYAYLRHESNLITLFGKQWQLIKEIPNETGYRSNALKLYRRAAP